MRWRKAGKILIALAAAAAALWIFTDEPPPIQREVSRLADQIKKASDEMTPEKALAKMLVDMVPKKKGDPLPPGDAAMAARNAGVKFKKDSCIWRLSGLVVDARTRGWATEEEWAEINRLKEECDAGLR